MKKLTQTILASLFAAVFILFFTGCPNDAMDTDAANRAARITEDEALPQRDAKIYSRATIKDNFCDSSLVVILDNFTGGVNRRHEERFFGTFEKEAV